MKSVGIRYAKAHLARLIEQAVNGKPFLIAKSGIPVVKVERVDATPTIPRRGFLDGEISVPEDFDRMGAAAIGSYVKIEEVRSAQSRTS